MISVTFKAKNIHDLKSQCLVFVGETALQEVQSLKEEAPAKKAKAAPKKSAKTQIEETQETAEAQSEQVQEEPPVNADKHEAIVAALQELNASHGLIVAKKVLLKFGAARISELNAKDYDAFIKECKKPTVK